MNTNGALLDDEDKEKKSDALDISPQAIGLIAAAFAIPVDLYLTHLGDAEEGRAAFIFIFATLLTIMYRWKLRRMWWFWMTIVIMAVAEVHLVQHIHWYKGSLPPISLLPLAMILSAIQFGCVALARKVMSENGGK